MRITVKTEGLEIVIEDGDAPPLASAGPSDELKRYRNARAEMAELELEAKRAEIQSSSINSP